MIWVAGAAIAGMVERVSGRRLPAVILCYRCRTSAPKLKCNFVALFGAGHFD
jgi:hypothetical protein